MTGLIILAAGSSSRLGRAKQNLLYQHKTLLQRAIETALASVCRPVIVVLGANANQIESFSNADLIVLHNDNWNDGISSSIRTGIQELKKNNAIEQCVIMLCDQPFVTSNLIDSLIEMQNKTGNPVTACTYNKIIGVPALFNRSLFPDLLLLQGHEGAKKILKNYPHISTVPFDQGNIDIDTLSDYEQLLKSGD